MTNLPLESKTEMPLGSDTDIPLEPGSGFPLQTLNDLDAFTEIMDECNYKAYQEAKNYASYSTREMGGYSDEIMDRFKRFNFVDQSLPSQAFGVEGKCVDMLSELWNAPNPKDVLGLTTTGSSEACILAGLSLKQNWKNCKAGKGKPNLVISSEYHVTWEKFCRLFDVELRAVPITATNLNLDIDHAISLCDENTIGVVAILGSSGLGLLDDVETLNNKLEVFNASNDLNITIHVDAASGGFFTPFTDPNLVWDFRLKLVTSINASGHKYGLVYPSVGWILWKTKIIFPEEMSFSLNYIGGTIENVSLNFSKPMAQVLAQYYQFKRLGREGYAKIHNKSRRLALMLIEELKKFGCFEIINDGKGLPVVCWVLKTELHLDFTLFDLADRLKKAGLFIPAYTLPSNLTDLVVQRVVINSDIHIDEIRGIVRDIAKSLKVLAPALKTAASPAKILECV